MSAPRTRTVTPSTRVPPRRHRHRSGSGATGPGFQSRVPLVRPLSESVTSSPPFNPIWSVGSVLLPPALRPGEWRYRLSWSRSWFQWRLAQGSLVLGSRPTPLRLHLLPFLPGPFATLRPFLNSCKMSPRAGVRGPPHARGTGRAAPPTKMRVSVHGRRESNMLDFCTSKDM